MKIKYLLKGVVKSLPGIEYIYKLDNKTGGTDNAKYCYAVWLRHLVAAYESGLNPIPQKIAELGPGDSLGVGISALISGSEQYYALDVIKYCNAGNNLKIFEELINLFRNKTTIPSENEFPKLKPALKNYDFPAYIFTNEYLEKMLDENRLAKIRNSIKAIDNPGMIEKENMIIYKAPWYNADLIEPESIDVILSQAVLQHVDDLELTYKCMHKWLKKKGVLSHSIDLGSMRSSDTWDGHWCYTDTEWKIIRGRKRFLINREPYSAHIKYLKENDFHIVCDKKSFLRSTIKCRKALAPRFRELSDEDLTISGTFIQAIK